jgi:hypothetical protein
VKAEPEQETRIVDIDASARQEAPVEPTGARQLLAPSVRLIRQGGCGAAVGQLKAIYGRMADRVPPELYYLMGWCLRSAGKHDSAAPFFTKYSRLARSRTFVLPAGPATELPLPRVSQLSE